MIALLVLARPVRAEWLRAALYGGDVRALAVDPLDPDRLFAGTSAGQIYVSSNGGHSWEPGSDQNPLAGWVISELVHDPSRPDRLWAALWGIWGGGTVVFSDDGGSSWVPRQHGLPGEQVYALAFLPQQGRMFAATRTGVFVSDDEGGAWRHATRGHPEIQKVTSLLTDARRPGLVIAGTWRRAYRSDDGGETWRGAFEGMVLDSEIFTLLPGERPGEVWASTCGWVYRGDGWGEQWTRHRQGLTQRRTPSLELMKDGRMVAGTVSGVFVSQDHGVTWQPRGPRDLPVHAIAWDARRPDRILIGTEGGGIWRSDDRGEHFRDASRGLTALRVSALAAQDGEILAAVRSAGAASGVYSSFDGGRTFQGRADDLPTVLSLAVSGGSVLAGTDRGLYERQGTTWRSTNLLPNRVEQLVSGEGRLLARTPGGVFERAGGSFIEISPATSRRGETSSLTVVEALSREGDTLREALIPELANGARARVVATADPEYPVISLGNGREGWLHRRDGRHVVELSLPISGRDVAAALLERDRLLLGTSGFGLLARSLAITRPDPVVSSGR